MVAPRHRLHGLVVALARNNAESAFPSSRLLFSLFAHSWFANRGSSCANLPDREEVDFVPVPQRELDLHKRRHHESETTAGFKERWGQSSEIQKDRKKSYRNRKGTCELPATTRPLPSGVHAMAKTGQQWEKALFLFTEVSASFVVMQLAGFSVHAADGRSCDSGERTSGETEAMRQGDEASEDWKTGRGRQRAGCNSSRRACQHHIARTHCSARTRKRKGRRN